MNTRFTWSETGSREQLSSKVVPSSCLYFNSVTQVDVLKRHYLRARLGAPGKRPLKSPSQEVVGLVPWCEWCGCGAQGGELERCLHVLP